MSKSLVDLYLEAIGQRIGLVGHSDDCHQFGQHLVAHTLFSCRRGMAVDAVLAPIGDTHSHVNHLFGEGIDCSCRHHLFDPIPGSLQELRLNR